jgi:hypothetical protein
LIEKIMKHPQSEGKSREEAIAAYYRAKKKQNDDLQKTKESEARIKSMRDRANRIANPKSPKPRLMGEGILKTIGEKKAMRKKAAQLMASIDSLSEEDIGLLEDLKEKYGSYVGIQDNQIRMQYKGLFNKVLRDRSGMTVTDTELARLEEEIPSWRAGKDVILASLDHMITELEDEIITTEETQIEQGGRTVPNRSSFPKKQEAVDPLVQALQRINELKAKQ